MVGVGVGVNVGSTGVGVDVGSAIVGVAVGMGGATPPDEEKLLHSSAEKFGLAMP